MFWKRRPEVEGNDAAILAAAKQSQAIIFFQPDGTILDANDAFVKAMGYADVAEIAGKHHRIFMPTEDGDSAAYKQFWPSLARGEMASGEFRRVGKAGNDIWISASYAPVRDAVGNVIQIVKIASDVTASHQMMNALIDALNRLHQGDLTVRLTQPVGPDSQPVWDSFNSTVEGLQQVLVAIRSGATTLGNIGQAVQHSADELSHKAQHQIEMLNETSASLSQISSAVSDTSKSAHDLDHQAGQTAEESRDGTKIVTETIDAIKRIEHLSNEVSKTTEIIESFAFQTNLLSLNAAVEAARAGNAGRGFAVVATEVRNLANRSAEASKGIAKLTRSCEHEVAKGRTLIEAAGSSLETIENGAATVAAAVDKIAIASREQAEGVSKIETAIRNIDDGVQHVAQLSAGGVSQAQQLSDQLRMFDDMLSRFQTDANGSITQHMHQDRRLQQAG